MKKKMIRLLCLLLCAASLAGCCLKHDWEEATCEQPRTCSECGKTEGSKGDHEWERATCVSPKTCEICGKERGELGDHKWAEATCTEPAVCKYCGETQGRALGHSWDGGICSECGQTQEAAAPQPPVMDGAFTFTPEEFLERYNARTSSIKTPVTLGSKRYDTESMISYYMDCQEEHVLKVNIILDETTGRITQIQITPEDTAYASDELRGPTRDATLNTVYAVFPEMTAEEWYRISQDPVNSSSRNGKTSDTFVIDGVRLTFTTEDSTGIMSLTCVPDQ